MDRRQSQNRAGFTLIEVLVAVLIIATLIAILLPAIAGAMRTARRAQVTAELNNLATALASFKNTYGDYPPSRVVLCEQGYTNFLASSSSTGTPPGLAPGSTDTDMTIGQLVARSRLYLRKFWPRVDFDGASAGGFDFNGDGTSQANPIFLSGSECLTFFLGGIPIANGDGTFAMSGFSKFPTNPFLPAINPSNGTPYTSAQNRTVFNYEFNTGRLIDMDHDHIPSYIDPLDLSPANQRAYAYFSSYGNNSYDPNDVNGYGRNFDASGTSDAGDFELEDDGSTFAQRGFTVAFPPGSVLSPGPNPYTSGAPYTTGTVTWINPNSFQLFSAGADRLWGIGGLYLPNGVGPGQTGSGYVTKSPQNLPVFPNGTDGGNVNMDDTTGIRYRESDNLTNFASGPLN